MKQVIALSIVLLGFCQSAEACNRCGLFGLRCRYYKSPVKYVAPYVAPVAVVKQADVFVVQNNYPQPIGAIAQQGNSVYGYQAAAQAYFVNPAEVIRQAAELSKAASATATIGLTGFNQTAQTQLALQASISEPLARGAAAAQVLGAAGLSQPTLQTQTLALKITQGPNGYQVAQVDPTEVNAQIAVKAEVGLAPEAPTVRSVLAEKCARCHGVSLREPKANLYFDAGQSIDVGMFRKAVEQVHSGKMPKDSPLLTPQEKTRLLEELLILSKENPQ